MTAGTFTGAAAPLASQSRRTSRKRHHSSIWRRLGRLSPMIASVVIGLAACSSSGSGSDMPAYRTQQAEIDLTRQTYATASEVVAAVAAAQSLQAMPPAALDQLVALSQVARSESGAEEARPQKCFDKRNTRFAAGYTTFGSCAYGDPNGAKLVVVYGDALASMWTTTLERVAAIAGWKVRMFSRASCPVADLQFQDNRTGAPDVACDEFHDTAVEEIDKLQPDLVVTVGNVGRRLVTGDVPTPAQWQDGWVSTFRKLARPGRHVAMIGAIPTWENNDAKCLADHLQDVQACSTERTNTVSEYAEAEKMAAAATGTHFVDVVPWVCADTCQPVIADTIVYYTPSRFTKEYAVYLSGAVAEALETAIG